MWPGTSSDHVALTEWSFRPSEDGGPLDEMEKQSLCNKGLATKRRPGILSQISLATRIPWIACGILIAINSAQLLAFLSLKHEAKHEPHRSWLPPEIPRTSLFEFQTLFGAPLNNKSEAAWDELMPVGRGFVVIKNDTILPEQPGLDQSIEEQKAMVAVFHQLHCLVSQIYTMYEKLVDRRQYMTREGYYSALEGNPSHVSKAHLTHCFDYLRQTIMCFSDTTLEWLPAPPHDTGSTGWGFQHTCRDFNAISQWAEKNRLKTTFGIH